jgi:molybdenum cofactor cytidylyltransferase
MPSTHVFGLILAAGQGQRFGGDKLLADLNGKPVLGHVLAWVGEAIRAGLLEGAIGVIPPHQPDRERLLLDSSLEYVFNPFPERGVAETIRTGLAALAARHPDARAVLVIQGDQPGLRQKVLEAILRGWHTGGRPVVRPRYAGEPDRPGHPVLLERSIWNRAAELEGDTGFAPLLKASPDLVTTVDVDGINPDINTPSDLVLLELPLR